MKQKLRILNLEDSETDAELIQAKLEEEGIVCELTRVETERDFVAAISRGDFDLLLVDYKLPSFDGMSALAIAREKCAEIPFIFVSGSIGEDTAIEALKNGATDYVLKDKLSRLAPAVRRALKEAEERIERKQAEVALRESEDRYRSLFENSIDAVLLTSPDGRVLAANPEACRIFGRDEEEICRLGRQGLVDETDPRLAVALEERARTGKFRGELTLVRKDGTKFPGEISTVVYKDRQGLVKTSMSIRDITERKRAQEVLREKEVFIKTVMDNLPIGIAVNSLDPAVIFQYMNDNFVKCYRTTRDALTTPDAFWDAVYENPDFREEMRKRVLNDCASGDPERMHWVDVPITRRGEEITYIEARNSLVLDTKLMVSTVWDVTARKTAEMVIQESERKYKHLIETTLDGIYQSDSDGVFAVINQTGAEIFGYASPEEIIGKKVIDFWADSEEKETFLAELKNKKAVKSWPIRAKRKDGTVIHLEASSHIVEDEQGSFTGIEGILRDVTEKKRLEEQLRQSQKMEAVGQLAGGIAHDFNNILSAIIGYGDMIKRKMASDDPLQPNVEQILEAADRAAQLTKSLLAFSRRQVMNPKPADLNEIIRKIEKFLIRVIGEDIELKTELADRELAVLADSGQIEQALMNLATNARDAMPKGGLLTIDTDTRTLEDDFIRAHGYGSPGEYVVISVADTGIGMSEQTRLRIFEPFFTTKEMGKGTGLGMSIVYGIIKQHNGFINVYSEPGQGATFRIYLPLIRDAEAKEKKPEVREYPARGTETILVAEDDATLRKLSESVLKEFGYTVILAEDGAEAVRKFSENKDLIQLCMLDMIMPKKNGKEAYNEIKKIEPDIKALFVSGYTADIMLTKGIVEEGFEFIMKPLSPMDLLRKVREILDRD